MKSLVTIYFSVPEEECLSCEWVYLGWGGFSPLHYAALHGNRSLVDFFLSAGADPNVTCDAGQTAFHFACR